MIRTIKPEAANIRTNAGKVIATTPSAVTEAVYQPPFQAIRKNAGKTYTPIDPFLSSVVFLLAADRYYSPFNLNVQHLTGLTLSTIDKKYGSHSYLFNIGPYIEITDSNVAFGTGVFTIDFWINPISYGDDFSRVGTTITNATGWTIYTTTGNPRSIALDIGNGGGGTGVGTVSAATWSHVAFTRGADTRLRSYLNGSLVSTSGVTNVNLSNTTFRLGVASSGVERLSAYIDSYRITKAVRYTGNFDPEADTYLRY